MVVLSAQFLFLFSTRDELALLKQQAYAAQTQQARYAPYGQATMAYGQTQPQQVNAYGAFNQQSGQCVLCVVCVVNDERIKSLLYESNTIQCKFQYIAAYGASPYGQFAQQPAAVAAACTCVMSCSYGHQNLMSFLFLFRCTTACSVSKYGGSASMFMLCLCLC